ncbi:hypothetical protein [Lacticaseibacillus parakribbianus]|uniref:hypothetical protein n=1 Tax=Lacticaseibacillus parakribbianus TaxID=2970927 RepID=UPI0021CB2B6B|nr:hypothetical protein [Lacticaseibacillus parakribbianus]
MKQREKQPRFTVQIVGGFSGKLLNQSLEITNPKLLVVSVTEVVHGDVTLTFPPTLAYLDFHPEASRFGKFIWEVGDILQLTGRVIPCYEYRGHDADSRLRFVEQRFHSRVVAHTQRWLTQLPRAINRRPLTATLSRYLNHQLSFNRFQEQMWRLARPLPAPYQRGLHHVQLAQVQAIRSVYQQRASLAPEHLLITDVRHLTTKHLATPTPPNSRQPEISLVKARLQDPAYLTQLLRRITNQNPVFPPHTAAIPTDAATPLASPAIPTLALAPASPAAQSRVSASTLVSLTITVQRARTVCAAPATGPLTPVDTLAATVSDFALPPQAPDGTGAYFNPHFATCLVYDAALARLQLTPGYQGTLTGTLTQVRVVAPAQQAALARAQKQVLHHLRRLLDQSLATFGDPILPAYAQLSAKLAAGQLDFAAYRKALATLRPAADPPLADQAATRLAGLHQKVPGADRPGVVSRPHHRPGNPRRRGDAAAACHRRRATG